MWKSLAIDRSLGKNNELYLVKVKGVHTLSILKWGGGGVCSWFSGRQAVQIEGKDFYL